MIADYIKFSRLMIFKVIGMVLSFVLGILIARLYGAVGTGVYYLYLSFISGLAILATFGAEKLVIKEIGEMDDTKGVFGLIIQHYFVTLIISFVIIVLLVLFGNKFILYFFKESNAEIILIYIMISVPILSLININSGVFIGLHRQEISQLIDTVSLPLITIIAGAAMFYILQPVEPDNIVFARLLTIILILLIGIYLIAMRYYFSDIYHLPYSKIFYESWPIFGVNLLTFFSQWTSTFMLAFYMSESDVGIYNTAWRLVIIVSTVNFIFNKINAPHFAKDFKNNLIDKIESRAARTASVCAGIGFCILTAMIICSRPLLGLYGEAFIEGSVPLVILAVGQFIAMSCGSAGYLLMMTGHASIQRNLLFVVFIAQVIVLPLTIEIYGLVGASVIQSISIMTINLFCIFFIYKRIGVKAWPNFKYLIYAKSRYT